MTNKKDYWHPMFDEAIEEVRAVLEHGAKKHGADNWLTVGNKMSHDENHASMFRHLAKSQAREAVDSESGRDHIVHLITRALMEYTCKKLNKHDRPTETDKLMENWELLNVYLYGGFGD